MAIIGSNNNYNNYPTLNNQNVNRSASAGKTEDVKISADTNSSAPATSAGSQQPTTEVSPLVVNNNFFTTYNKLDITTEVTKHASRDIAKEYKIDSSVLESTDFNILYENAGFQQTKKGTKSATLVQIKAFLAKDMMTIMRAVKNSLTEQLGDDCDSEMLTSILQETRNEIAQSYYDNRTTSDTMFSYDAFVFVKDNGLNFGDKGIYSYDVKTLVDKFIKTFNQKIENKSSVINANYAEKEAEKWDDLDSTLQGEDTTGSAGDVKADSASSTAGTTGSTGTGKTENTTDVKADASSSASGTTGTSSTGKTDSTQGTVKADATSSASGTTGSTTTVDADTTTSVTGTNGGTAAGKTETTGSTTTTNTGTTDSKTDKTSSTTNTSNSTKTDSTSSVSNDSTVSADSSASIPDSVYLANTRYLEKTLEERVNDAYSLTISKNTTQNNIRNVDKEKYDEALNNIIASLQAKIKSQCESNAVPFQVPKNLYLAMPSYDEALDAGLIYYESYSYNKQKTLNIQKLYETVINRYNAANNGNGMYTGQFSIIKNPQKLTDIVADMKAARTTVEYNYNPNSTLTKDEQCTQITLINMAVMLNNIVDKKGNYSITMNGKTTSMSTLAQSFYEASKTLDGIKSMKSLMEQISNSVLKDMQEIAKDDVKDEKVSETPQLTSSTTHIAMLASDSVDSIDGTLYGSTGEVEVIGHYPNLLPEVEVTPPKPDSNKGNDDPYFPPGPDLTADDYVNPDDFRDSNGAPNNNSLDRYLESIEKGRKIGSNALNAQSVASFLLDGLKRNKGWFIKTEAVLGKLGKFGTVANALLRPFTDSSCSTFKSLVGGAEAVASVASNVTFIGTLVAAANYYIVEPVTDLIDAGLQGQDLLDSMDSETRGNFLDALDTLGEMNNSLQAMYEGMANF